MLYNRKLKFGRQTFNVLFDFFSSCQPQSLKQEDHKYADMKKELREEIREMRRTVSFLIIK